jgi:hypothetical protein
VRLVSNDRVLVELRPISYEFDGPGGAETEGFDPIVETNDEWDDWLVIRGDASTADGRSWTFTDPCLTAREAEYLSAWLDAVSRATADRDAAVFTEPNVSLFVDGRDGDRVRMRVRFSHESLPSWLPRDVPGWQAGEFCLPLEVNVADLAEAARAWDAERQAFPARYS